MFKTPLVLEAAPEADQWIVRAPLVWVDEQFGAITVPDGFQTDLASIPGVLRSLPEFDPDSLSRRPGVMHDWLYTEKPFSRENADAFLYAALRAEGVTSVVAYAYYKAVRWFGGGHW